MRNLQLLEQAINKAQASGVYSLEESTLILNALVKLKEILDEQSKDAEPDKKSEKGK